MTLSSVQILPSAMNHAEETPVSNPVGDTGIDVGIAAKKALASLCLTFTNSLLSISVGVMKLTGLTIIPSLAIGHLTKSLHKANDSLAKHAFTPFREWAEALSRENHRIIETEKVISLKDKRLLFYPKNYVKQTRDSFKAMLAPISLALSAANVVAWVATKPLYLLFWAPGFIADATLFIPIAINKGLGRLTYDPVAQCSDMVFDKYCNWLATITPKHRS